MYGLTQRHKLSFHSVFGTSVGALNGCAYLQDTFERLQKIWCHVRTSDLLKFRPRLRPLSLFSQEHMRRYLSRLVDEERARRLKRCWFYVVSTDIASGKIHQACYSPEPDGPWDSPLVEHLLGSVSIPFVLPPVRIDLNGAGYRLLIDGQAKSYVNLWPAIARGVKDLVFLNVIHPSELSTPGLGLRSYISTLNNQLLQGQIDHSLESIRAAGLKDVRAYVFHPSKPLMLRSLKFDGECNRAFALGVEDADRSISDPEPFRVL